MGLLYGIELCGASLHCVFIYYAALYCTFLRCAFYTSPFSSAVAS